MPKAIIVESCNGCSYRDHRGAFGRVAYIPVCRKANKELPWVASGSATGVVNASFDGTIPDWCPLPNVEVQP